MRTVRFNPAAHGLGPIHQHLEGGGLIFGHDQWGQYCLGVGNLLLLKEGVSQAWQTELGDFRLVLVVFAKDAHDVKQHSLRFGPFPQVAPVSGFALEGVHVRGADRVRAREQLGHFPEEHI